MIYNSKNDDDRNIRDAMLYAFLVYVGCYMILIILHPWVIWDLIRSWINYVYYQATYVRNINNSL